MISSVCFCVFFFFFKQKTAYEMRISDWSSDVCSSDLLLERLRPVIAAHGVLRVKGLAAVTGKAMRLVVQGVGERLQHYYDRDWRPGEARATRLVFIGETGLDEAAHRAAGPGSAACGHAPSPRAARPHTRRLGRAHPQGA